MSDEREWHRALDTAWREIRRLRAKVSDHEARQARSRASIAVIGLGCRLPGGIDSPVSLSNALASGIDAIGEVPPWRWDVARYYDPSGEVPGTCPVTRGGFVDGVDEFDPAAFGISVREAEELDPQHRLLLEVAWETFHHSGRSRSDVAGSKTGVFVGVSMDDYSQRGINSADATRISAYSSLGTARSIAAGRISYTFDLKGPALQLDTTCSSSLLAIHLACHSLSTGECDLALAGGVNVMSAPAIFIGFWNLRALSPDGICRTFDAAANGYVRGEGCSMVLLKRLSDAERDKDRVLATIQGSGANHDGRSNGLTAPNGAAQYDLIREVLRRSGVDPRDIGYTEAHGTGTELGDPIEVDSIARALECTDDRRPVYIGSVKANLGHLEAGAGATSFIKAVMSVAEGRIFPQINVRRLNPRVPWNRLAIRVPGEVQPWPEGHRHRYASINAFGMSGTNVHVIVRNHEPSAAPPLQREVHPLVVQGMGAEDAARSACHMAQLLRDGERLADVALSHGRRAPLHGLAQCLVVGGVAEALERLATLGDAAWWEAIPKVGRPPRIALVVGGVTPSLAELGRTLLETCSEFRTHVQTCEAASRELRGDDGVAAPSTIAWFTHAYAFARTLLAFGVRPEVIHGSGAGELVVAAAREVLSVRNALSAVSRRDLASTASASSRLPTEVDAVVEIGRDVELRERLAGSLEPSVPWLGQWEPCNTGWRALLDILGELHGRGAVVDWERVNLPFASSRAPLPRPAFQRTRFWIEYPTRMDGHSSRNAGLLGGPAPGVRAPAAAFEWTLEPTEHDFVSDHKVHDRLVVPGATYISVAAELAARLRHRGCTLTDLVFPHALVIDPAERHQVRTELRSTEGETRFEVSSAPVGEDGQGAEARVRAQATWSVEDREPRADGEAERPLHRSTAESQAHAQKLYDDQRARGIDLGSSFRWVTDLWVDPDGVLAVLREPATGCRVRSGTWHPGLVDAAFQVLGASIALETDRAFIPWRIEAVTVRAAPPAGPVWCRGRARREGDRLIGDLELEDTDGRLLLRIRGLEARSVAAADLHPRHDLRRMTWGLALHPVEGSAEVRRSDVWWMGPTAPGLERQLERLGCDVVRIEEREEQAWTRQRTRTGREPSLLLFCVAPGIDEPVPAVAEHLLATASLLRRLSWNTLLVLVTHRGVAVPGEEADPKQSAIFAMAGSLESEGFAIQRVDTDELDSELCARAVTSDDATRVPVVLRGGGSYRLRVTAPAGRTPAARDPVELDPKRSYLVTGGTGGLGLLALDALWERGARRFLVVSRRSPGPEAARRFDDIRRAGGSVRPIELDLGLADAREELRRILFDPSTALGGVVHAAGSTRDRAADGLHREDLELCFGAKAEAALHLVEWAEQLGAGFVILLSSLSSVVGTPGQAAYVLANGFLDGLAAPRSNVVALNLGPWAGVGLAARLDETQQARIRARGVQFLDPRLMGTILDHALRGETSARIVAPVDWATWAAQAGPAQRDLVSEVTVAATSGLAATTAPLQRLELVPRKAAILARLCGRVAAMVGGAAENVAPEEPLSDHGMDSLLAVELHDALREEFGVTLSMSELLADSRPDAIAGKLAMAMENERLERGGEPGLVSLRAGATGGPRLYLIHAVDGDVLSYVELASALPPWIDVWGVRSPLLSGHGTDVKELAAWGRRYGDFISKHQATGPIHLAGWSLGGTLAVEAARHLQALGRTVAGLTLVDSYAPFGPVDWSDAETCSRLARMLGAMLGRTMEVAPGALSEVPLPDRIAYLLSHAETTGVFPSAGTSGVAFRSGIEMMLAALCAPLDLPAEVVHATNTLADPLSNTSTDWETYLPRATFRAIDADHQTIHRGSSGTRVAEILAAGIERAERNRT